MTERFIQPVILPVSSGDIFIPRPNDPSLYDLSERTYERALNQDELRKLGWPDATPAEVITAFADWERDRMDDFRESEEARSSGAQYDIKLSNGEMAKILVLPKRQRNTGTFSITDEKYCFLDAEGQEPLQRGLLVQGGQHTYLNNPFSITQNHGVIATNYHTVGQKLGIPHFGIEMAIAKALGEEYTVWDNHQNMGASAKSHPHIQSGKIITPIYNSIQNSSINDPNQRRPIRLNKDVTAYLAGALIGSALVVESESEEALQDALETMDGRLKDNQDPTKEAPANRTLTYREGTYTMVYHPRDAFRPDGFKYCVHAEGGDSQEEFRVSGAALEKDRVIPVPDAYPDNRSAEAFMRKGIIGPLLETVISYGYPSRSTILQKLGVI